MAKVSAGVMEGSGMRSPSSLRDSAAADTASVESMLLLLLLNRSSDVEKRG